MTICLASLVSGLVALYLHLWKIGRVGALACGIGGGCELVQHSSWSYVLGVDVALIGTIGYALLFAVSLISLQPRYLDARGPALLMAGMIGAALLFTLRLKYAEFVILRSFCPWCAVSAVAITLCTVMIALDLRRFRGMGQRDPASNTARARAI
ncbi:MAG: vitamin K epoxide reductase family protein [Gemmatimonadales bacterium]